MSGLDHTVARFLGGLRVAVLVIAATVLATASLLRTTDLHRPLWTQLAAYCAFAAIVTTELVLLVRGRSWGRARWPALVVAFAAAATSAVTLHSGAATGALDWAYGTVGWIGVLLLLDRPIGFLVGFLACHELLTVTTMVLGSGGGELAALNAAVAAIGALGFPFGTGLGATALRALAVTAHRVAEEAEDVRARDAVGAAVHRRRQERFAGLAATTVPLLTGLAERRLDPHDSGVRRACAIEAARMRRLFAETDEVSDPLTHELATCVDVAERRGVLVELETSGTWATPPLAVRRALTDAPLAALATAVTWARVTVVGTAGSLSVDVVADCGPVDLPAADPAVVDVETITEGGLLWVRAHWRTERSPR
ncbi:hypothetical protein [Actinokineospora globicatena]|uniref:Uncharacterized protein n=1 Tax=Actinokineospora globicatena TaxID=103729 RepID=A0A9W6QGC5_9PSEU|nr:hypothetical protein [Actinokineospora globicatena]GLW89591.1 hypothetical protein Aglo03_04070 [Actinokineospora globicatena]